MFTTRRYYLRYGGEYDKLDCTEKEFETAEKALRYLRRYQTGNRYVESDIYDEEAEKFVYEHTASHGEYLNLIET